MKDFSGGMADKNPPANAGDTGLILGPGRFHSLWATANELLCHNYWTLYRNYSSLSALEPVDNKRGHRSEKPKQRN